MNVREHFTYPAGGNHVVELRQEAGVFTVWIDDVDRTLDVNRILGNRPVSLWRRVATLIIDMEEEPAPSVTFTLGQTIAESNSDVPAEALLALLNGQDPMTAKDDTEQESDLSVRSPWARAGIDPPILPPPNKAAGEQANSKADGD